VGTKERRQRFKSDEIDYVHIDGCELRHAAGKLVMFLAIDRISKFTHVALQFGYSDDPGNVPLSMQHLQHVRHVTSIITQTSD
jgi:hypothetical protein